MAVRFQCTKCDQWLSIASHHAGATVWCPKCTAENVIPDADAILDRTPTELEASTEGFHEEPTVQGESDSSAAPTRGGIGDPEETGFGVRASGRTDHDSGDEGLVLRSPQTDFDDMDLTPMVDVTFLLLIFFMITASFSLQKSIEVPAPDPDEQGATQSITMDDLVDSSVKVEIDEQNNIYVDEDKLSDPNDLVDTIREQMKSGPVRRRNELLLIANARARHETVVTVIDAANEVGMQKIRLATEQR